MKIVILPSALLDLRDGYRFYEYQEAGLGTYFLDSLYSDIESLHLFAGIHGKHFGNHHRMLSKRFPYAIYYRVKGDEIVIRAILDCRQHPSKARRRLR